MTEENKYRKSRRGPVWAVILCIFLTLLCAIAYIFYKDEPADADAIISVHYIDVGQGDATLIICDSEAALIDAGPADSWDSLHSYLVQAGVTEFKYVISTHPDADHIGSMDKVLENYPVETYIASPRQADTYTFESLNKVLNGKNISTTCPAVGDKYSLGQAEFVILGPSEITDETSDNNCSVAIKLTCGSNSWLFAGDAESEEEAQMEKCGISLKCDVYKVSHHGSYSSSTADFLSAMDPDYAVISVGAGNDYDHPHDVTLRRLKAAGCRILRTDESGTIVCTSDGTSISWNNGSVRNYRESSRRR